MSDQGGAMVPAGQPGALAPVIPEPLIGLQTRYRELGRLRTGTKGVSKGGKEIPVKLNTWRLTSQGSHGRALLEHVARVYGGTVQEWKVDGREGEHWQITTESDSLRIIVPTGDVFSQYFELWSGGGCKRRCTGGRQLMPADRVCSCPADLTERKAQAAQGKACTPATRLSVVLPDIPDVGVWRMETHSYNAAEEMFGTFNLLRAATAAGNLIPARLTISHRERSWYDEDDKPHKSKFIVPVIEIEATAGHVIDALPHLSNEPRSELAEVEAKSLPSTAPALTTDPGAAQQSLGVEPVGFGDAPPPDVPQGLPSWVLELPGDDGQIIDAINALLVERGSVMPAFESLKDERWERMPGDLREALEETLAGGVE